MVLLGILVLILLFCYFGDLLLVMFGFTWFCLLLVCIL